MAPSALADTRSLDRAVLAMLLAALLVLPPRAAPDHAPASSSTAALVAPSARVFAPPPIAWPTHASLPPEAASSAVRELADSVLQAQDNARRPFLVIDKRAAQLYLIGADGGLVARTPVLLGAARGDDSVPGIGERPIQAIRFFERTTPAGRFEAALGRNAHGEEVVWVDYDAAISMHRVRATNPRERRLERLASPTSADNRVSYGCINVPVAFFDAFVAPLFRSGPHAVYILPETKAAGEVFGLHGSPRRAG